MKGIFRCLVIISILLLGLGLQSCASRGHGGGNPSSWGNYRCTASAKNGGYQAVGWATDKSRAKANALDKCREHSSNGTACHIVTCNNES